MGAALARTWAVVVAGAALCAGGCKGGSDTAPSPRQQASGGTSAAAMSANGGAAGASTGDVARLPSASCAVGAVSLLSAPANPGMARLDIPDSGEPVRSQVAPPAVSGGTLMVLADGHTAVAADADRDQIYVVDVDRRRVTATVALQPGDQPGRLVADGSGQVHVALRGGGAVVSFDPGSGRVTQRRAVCAAPRGLAYQPATGLLHVACAGGELVSLAAVGGPAVRLVHLAPDLRDVVVDGDLLRISRFRAAEVLAVDVAGVVSGRATLSDFRSPLTRGGQLFSPSVAWRMVGLPGGGVVLAHQRGVDDEVEHGSNRGGYGGNDPCHAVVHTAVSRVNADGSVVTGPALAELPLAVDMALSPDGRSVAVISAGNAHTVSGPGFASFVSLHVSDLSSLTDGKAGCRSEAGQSACGPGAVPSDRPARCSDVVPEVTGEAVAVTFAATGAVLVQSREPALLNVPGGPPIALSAVSRRDSGHELFHANTGLGLACASCHVEGTEDGRVWNFACVGRRRTQSLQMGVRGTQPFHWDGDEKDFSQLVRDVFTTRMSGPLLQDGQTEALLSWLDQQPRPARAPPADAAAAQRGRAVFQDASRAACATCHAGTALSTNETIDVGTGGGFQVASLVGIATHPPYMHTGCARTLRDRFLPECGGGDKHGKTSLLDAGELSDLLSYLETL